VLGNPLAVVIGADSSTVSELAAFARWTNLSEMTFLLQPRSADADYRVRIFTPVAELPFAGDPTLGSCHTWLSSGGRPKSDEIVQECEAGLIHIRRDNERLSFEAPELRRSGPVERDTLTPAIKDLRLTSDDIADTKVDNDPGWLAVLLRSRADVLALRPDFSVLSGLRVGREGRVYVELVEDRIWIGGDVTTCIEGVAAL